MFPPLGLWQRRAIRRLPPRLHDTRAKNYPTHSRFAQELFPCTGVRCRRLPQPDKVNESAMIDHPMQTFVDRSASPHRVTEHERPTSRSKPAMSLARVMATVMKMQSLSISAPVVIQSSCAALTSDAVTSLPAASISAVAYRLSDR